MIRPARPTLAEVPLADLSLAGDVAALCVSDGYASVNVQGWSVAGQFSTVTTAFLNFLKQKRYFHEQRNNQSVDNP